MYPGYDFFAAYDEWEDSYFRPIYKAKEKYAPNAKLAMDEVPLTNTEWCSTTSAATTASATAASKVSKASNAQATSSAQTKPPSVPTTPPTASACPDWTMPNSSATGINRHTLGWNELAAGFAYTFGRLAKDYDYEYVTMDQLVAGPYPNNFPMCAMLDWKTGEPNAKYYVLQQLARVFNTVGRSFKGSVGGHASSVKSARQAVPVCLASNHTSTLLPHPSSLSSSSLSCDGNSKHLFVLAVVEDSTHGDVLLVPNTSTTTMATSSATNPLANTKQKQKQKQKQKMLLVSKISSPQTVIISNTGGPFTVVVVDGAPAHCGSEPGFCQPTTHTVRAGASLTLGPFAVAVAEN